MELLEQAGYAKHTLWGNMYGSIRSVVSFYHEKGICNYDPAVTHEFIQTVEQRYREGEICREYYNAQKRAARKFEMFHSTGTLTWECTKGNTGFLCFRDDLHACIPILVEGCQFFQCRNGKEIPVQEEQGIPKSTGSTVSIFYHLHHMGRSTDAGTFPFCCGLEPIMETDGQGDTGPLPDASDKDAEAAEHMTVDVLRFCRIFRFLEKLFHSRHPATFF